MKNLFLNRNSIWKKTLSLFLTLFLSLVVMIPTRIMAEPNDVAEINGTNYETISDAISAAQNGDTIKLLADVNEEAVIPNNKEVVLDLNGKTLSSSGWTIVVAGKLTLIDNSGNGKVVATGGYQTVTGMDGSTIILGSEDKNLNNFTVDSIEGAVYPYKGSNITIYGGTYHASDNAVLIANGSEGLGGNIINVYDGIFNGEIKTANFVACGIYAPNNDTWNLHGGTFNITNGAGIVQRSGVVNIPKDSKLVINTTGSAVGRVGDSRVVVPCSAIVFDVAANYPTMTDASKTNVAGGQYTSDVDTVTTVGDGDRIVVTGGLFSDDLASVGNNSYKTLDAAIKAAQNGDTIKLLADVNEQAVIPNNKEVVLDLNGKTLSYTDDAAIRNHGTLTLIDSLGGGKVISVNEYAICTQEAAHTILGDQDDKQLNNFNVTGQEGAVFVAKNSATDIYGGNYKALDNAVLATNGTKDTYGGSEVNVYDGTFVGEIQSTGYVACGIYAPNNDTWNLYGGTFNITNGAGIVQRSGVVNIPENSKLVINTTGNITGKVGDSRVVVPCSAIVFDVAANYPTMTDASKTNVAGGQYTSKGDNTVTTVGDGERIEITGGKYSDDSGKNAVIPEGKKMFEGNDGFYTLETEVAEVNNETYKSLSDAITAAKNGDTIKLLADVNEQAVIPNNKEVVLDLNGKTLSYTDDAAIRNHGTLTLIDSLGGGKVISVNEYAICTQEAAHTILGDQDDKQLNNFNVTGQEGAVFVAKNSATDIYGGNYKALDNAVLATNGTKDTYGGSEVNVYDGTFVGEIQSTGYVACGIYAPNNDTWNLYGGTFNITNGAGIVQRSGVVNIPENSKLVINTTGNITGKVGDSRVVVPCSAIVFDVAANYPTMTDASKTNVAGGQYTSEASTVTTVGDGERIEITGGKYSDDSGNNAVVPEGKHLVKGNDNYYTLQDIEAKEISLNKEELTLEKGSEEDLVATILPTDTVNKTLTWTSSDEEVATVVDGKVKALKDGTTTIKVKTANDLEATCEVTVVTSIKKIEFENLVVELNVGEEKDLVAIITPNDATDQTLTWTSSDEEVATVNNGKVSALKEGNTVITVKTNNNLETTCVVIVKAVEVTSVSIDKTILMNVGETKTFNVTIAPDNATYKDVEIGISDEEVIKLTNNKYEIEALKAGVSVITVVTSNGKFATCTVKVSQLAESLSLNKEELELFVGEEFKLVATIGPEDTTNKEVTWTSTNEEVATVVDGNVKALKAGKATIKVETKDASGLFRTCEVTVNNIVASIDDTPYKSLDAAISAAQNGDTIKLLADVNEEAVIPDKKEVVLDLNGKTLSSNTYALYVDGKLTLIDNSGNGKVVATGKQQTIRGNDGSTIILGSEAKNLNNFTVDSIEGALWPYKGTNVTIYGGTYHASDNAVLIGNGSDGLGGSFINVYDGIFNGEIKSTGYIACGIYAPNNDTWNLYGGTFNITNGAGIVQRAGIVNIPENSKLVINTTGSATGFVGDRRIALPCSAIVFEETTNYHGLNDQSKTNIAGGQYTSEVDTVTMLGDGERIEITGGKYSDDSGNNAVVPEGKHLVKGNDNYYTLQDIEAKEISLNEDRIELFVNDEFDLVATILPTDTVNKTLTWSSNNEAVATVTNGKVKALKAGNAVITVKTANNLEATCEVHVIQIVKSLALNKNELELKIDEEFTLVATILPEDATDKTLTWTSSDEEVATVVDGKVKALKVGTTVIKAKTNDGSELEATCEVNVIKVVESLTLNKDKLELKVDEEFTLIPTILPEDANDKSLTWTSSNEEVATVVDGKVKALKVGTTVITAKTNDGSELEATCNITVKAKNLAQPKLVAIYNSANGADIRFKAVENATHYVIMRKFDGKWSAIKTIKASDLEKAGGNYKYIDETIKNNYGKGYIYSVAAKNNKETSKYDLKGLALYRLKQPTITNIVSNKKGQVTLTWSKEDCHGYEVQYSSDNGKTWTKANETKETSLTINNLKSNSQYAFRIRCQKTNPNRGVGWSQYSAWKGITVK